MMKWLGWLAIAILTALALPAMAKNWQVDPAHSTLTFTNSYQGVEYTGQFRRFDAVIDYDPNDLAHAKFDVTVDITSLDTRNSERDHTALGAEFFDTAKFPKAHFVTNAFRKTADGKIIAEDTPKNLIKALLDRGFKKEQHVEQADLEDVFIDLTGKGLRDA